MSVHLTISDRTADHLKSLSFPEDMDMDHKRRSLLEAEYRRRLARYHLTERQLSQKYGMNFETFEKEKVTEKQEYTWEVESDAIVWETAVDGIWTMGKRLRELVAQE